MNRQTIAVAAALLTASSIQAVLPAQGATIRHHYHHRHASTLFRHAGRLGGAPGPAYQRNTSGTHNNGYVYNGLGYGRYVPGPNGSFGGYPAGSAGAQELMIQQRRKCEAVPEEC